MVNTNNKALIEAYKRGYRIKNNKLISPVNGEIKGQYTEEGYHYFRMNFENKSTKIRAHRLAAYEKFGKKLFGKNIHVRHLDGNPRNNKFTNLELGTPSQNNQDKPVEVRKNAAKKAVVTKSLRKAA